MAVMISDSAWVDPRAKLADDVEIGPFCMVGPDVVLGRGTRLIGHVCLYGITVLGEPALRDMAFRTVIGDANIFHEGVVINRGGKADTGETRIGSHNQVHAGVHVAHDGLIGNRITIGNSSILGPRVAVEDHATLGPGVSVHHDVTVGQLSFIGGQSRIYHDVPPFMLVDGHPARVRCINAVGLRKQRLTSESIQAIHEAHRLIYRARLQPGQAMDNLQAHGHWTPEVQHLLKAVEEQNLGRHGRAREIGHPDSKAFQSVEL